MKRIILKKEYWSYSFVIFISFAVTFLYACSIISNSEAKSEISLEPVSPNIPNTKALNLETQNLEKSVEYKGVSFQSNIPLTSDIEAIEAPAVFLDEPSDKPDSVRPRHISLKLKGDYPKSHKDSFFQPKINIYPIMEFREALAKSDRYVEQFDKEIKLLENTISEESIKIKKLPRIPFYDGNPDITAKIKYISTRNAKGYLCLTQFNIEPSIINNQGLTYMFQGITSDNKYYILATFPVVTKVIPDTYDAIEFRGYILPRFLRGLKEYRVEEKEYNEYLISVENMLNTLNSNDFQPNLSTIKETISSLEIKQDNQ